MNERCLRFRELRVIAEDGSQVGVIPTRQALALAKEAGLDLVVVSPQAQPPVAKVIDYGKYKYEMEKREKESKRKAQDVKGIKITPRIADHDMEHLARNAVKFLGEGDKVRVVCQFRARELAHAELGIKRHQRFAEMVGEAGVIEKPPSLEGRQMVMILLPNPKKASSNNAKNPNEQDSSKAVQDHGQGQDNPA